MEFTPWLAKDENLALLCDAVGLEGGSDTLELDVAGISSGKFREKKVLHVIDEGLIEKELADVLFFDNSMLLVDDVEVMNRIYLELSVYRVFVDYIVSLLQTKWRKYGKNAIHISWKC